MIERRGPRDETESERAGADRPGQLVVDDVVQLNHHSHLLIIRNNGINSGHPRPIITRLATHHSSTSLVQLRRSRTTALLPRHTIHPRPLTPSSSSFRPSHRCAAIPATAR